MTLSRSRRPDRDRSMSPRPIAEALAGRSPCSAWRCSSRRSTARSSTSPCRPCRSSSAPPPASCSGSSTPTCSCSPACSSPPAASVTSSDATGAARSASSCSARRRPIAGSAGLAGGLIVGRALMGVGAAPIFPATLAIITNVFTRRRRAGQGDRHLERGQRHGGRRRADHRRLAARALLVGIDLLRQHPDHRRGRWSPSWSLRAGVQGHATRRASTGRAGALDRVHHGARVHDHRGARVGLAEPPTLGGFVDRRSRCSASFVWWELRVEHPLLPVRIFENLRFTAASVSVTSAFFALFGFVFLITQYFQLVRGYGPLEAGVRTLPVAFSIAAASVLSPRAGAADRHQARRGRRARVDGGRVPVGRDGVGVDAVPRDRRPDDPARRRPRRDHRPGDRVDHGLAQPRQGGRRLGGQRHHPRTRRHPRRRHRRIVFSSIYVSSLADGAVFSALGPERRKPRPRTPLPPPAESPRASAPRPARTSTEVSDAFLSGLAVSCVVVAGVAIAGCLFALRFLPAHARA